MASNISRRASRKKQTRLTFDPVEPSSSATMSPARVRYQRGDDHNNGLRSSPLSKLASEDDVNETPSSGKKKSFFSQTPKRQEKDSKLQFSPQPTPATSNTRSSQSRNYVAVLNDSDDSDDGPLRPFRANRLQSNDPTSSISLDSAPTFSAPPSFLNTRPTTNRDTKGFGAHEDSSEGSAPEDDIPKTSSASKELDVDTSDSEPLMIYSGRATSRRVPKNGTQASSVEKSKKPRTGRSFISGGYSAPVVRPSPKKPSRNKETSTSARRRKSNTTESSEHEETDNIFPTPRRTQRVFRRTQQIEVEEDSDEPILPAHSSQRGKRASQQSKGEDTDDDFLPDISEIRASSSKKQKGRSINKKSAQVDDDDSDDVVLSSSTKRRHTTTIDDDEDEPIVSSPLKRRRVVTLDDDEDEDEAPSSPSKRLRQGSKGKGRGNIAPRNDGEDEEDDVNDSKRSTRQKHSRKPHRSEREKKMELLRRKRAGEKITELTPSASEDEDGRRAMYDTDSDLQVLSEFEDEEEDDVEAESTEQVRRAIRKPLIKTRTEEGDEEDIDDDNFIVEDDEAPLGAPSSIHHLHEIPLEFTHQAHKPLKEHFKDAVEWMVQNRINPRFARSDPIYTRAFTKLDDEVRGYALSKFTSSAWNERFTRALWARPAFYEADLSAAEIGLEKKCDACGRSGHPARFQIMFSGRAYSKSTLEVVDDGKEREDEEEGEGEEGADSNPFARRAKKGKGDNENALDTDEDPDEDDASSTSSSNSSAASLNSTGLTLPRTTHVWNVGRFCKSNAETAHSLIHWKHALNEWVVEQLRGEGELEGKKLAEREKWSTARAGKHANAIVDRWEDEGVIKGLYRDFKGNLEGARESRQGRWG